ncbi:MAG: hypothetical protein K2P78_02905 [Gemmataceae bacterium]|nr:hypothetical protein [Gemmataceae bacterium]
MEAVHVVVDDYGTHEHPRARGWFARHPGFAPHFTPTSRPWPNQVERLFAQTAERRVRRGAFESVAERGRAIEDYLRARHQRPRPFVRTTSADRLLDKVRKRAERLAPPGKPAPDS